MQLQSNIIQIIESEGIKLKRSGKCYKGLCIFHEDKNPSFYVYPDSNRFVCFGCGEKGDTIDFVRKLKNFTFKEALGYLSVDQNTTRYYQKDSRHHRKRELIKEFRQWCDEYYNQLADSFRIYNLLISKVKSINHAERYAFIYHQLSVIEYHLDILLFGTDQEKYQLFKGVTYDI